MLENQARRQAQHKNDKEAESTLGKWTFGVSSDFLCSQFFLLIVFGLRAQNTFKHRLVFQKHVSHGPLKICLLNQKHNN